jgi:hypothetical protein
VKQIYPQPGYSDADLHTLLVSGEFIYAEAITIVPKVGDTILYTNGQRDVSVVPIIGGPGRVTYQAGKVIVKGLRYKTAIGVEVDEQTIDMAYSDEILYQGFLTWPEALKQGRLDGADIRRDRYFAESWDSPWIAGIRMFAGKVSNLDKVGRMSATINVKSDLVLLNIQMPKDLWQPQCKNSWADGLGCPVDRSLHVVQTTVGGPTPTRSFIPWTGATDDFNMGTCYIESFDNVTRVRTILKSDPGVGVHLIYPLDFDPTVGQDISFYPNCRRLEANCGTYNANPEETFIGFPFVPIVETAL